MILLNPGSGTHWFIEPNDEKWVCRSSKIKGSKNVFGSEVTAIVLVRTVSGDDARVDDAKGDIVGLFPQLRVAVIDI